MASTSVSISNIGNVAIIFSLFATCVALTIHSIIAIKEHKFKSFQEVTRTENIYHYGLIFYILSFIFISISLASLTIGFITHDYSLKYVYENSSNSLPIEFVVSAVWAGQEGSFLFWLWITVLVGFILYRKPLRMLSNYALIPVFIFIINLLLILLKSNPFLLLSETPQDGLGLNPLLEDFWMVFHPPMLFLGYASMILPFSLAFSSMIRRDYDTWVNFGIKYSILGILTLGIGIILGAYWAYKVLGWGGYWGWDNVENVSLIPWLIVIALLHLLIVQKYKKCLIKTNIFLAIISFILIIYGSCLTRSGILSDFSKHSFVDYGIGSYLLLFLLQFITIGLAPFLSLFIDSKNHKEKSLGRFELNREWGLAILSCIFIGYAILILLGTSYPLITGIINGTKNSSNVSMNYYETISIPIGCLLSLMLILLPYLKWSNSKNIEWKKLILSFILSIIISFIIAVIYILPELSSIKDSLVNTDNIPLGNFHNNIALIVIVYLIILLTGIVSYVFNINKELHNRILPVRHTIHIGIILIMLGFIFTSYLSVKQILTLDDNMSNKSLGYDISLNGIEKFEEDKEKIHISIKSNEKSFQSEPILYSFFSKQENQYKTMQKPDISTFWNYDFYVSANKSSDYESIKIARGSKGELKGISIIYENVLFQSENELMDNNKENNDDQDKSNPHFSSSEENKKIIVVAECKVNNGDNEYLLKPSLIFENGKTLPGDVIIPNSNKTLMLLQLLPDEKAAVFGLGPIEERITLEISRKPFILSLWIGSILLIASLTFSYFLYRVKQKSSKS